jgi:hypothetical protein
MVMGWSVRFTLASGSSEQEILINRGGKDGPGEIFSKGAIFALSSLHAPMGLRDAGA